MDAIGREFFTTPAPIVPATTTYIIRDRTGQVVALHERIPVPGPERKRFVWRQPDGQPVACREKLKVLNDNLEEIRQFCQDALEDAVLMGCEEEQVRQAFEEAVRSIRNPYARSKESR